MKNSNKKLIAGVGVGAGLVGLAGGLVLAYRKAKKQDKTIRELIVDKTKKKNNKIICNCNHEDGCCCNDCDSDQITIDEVDDLFNELTNEEIEMILEEEGNSDLFNEEYPRESEESVEEIIASRDYYKEQYELLLARLEEADENPEREG